MTERPLFDVGKVLEEIGTAVMTALAYQVYPLKRLEVVIGNIEKIRNHNEYLIECENHLKSAGSNYVLFFLSNIIYNLKKQGDLILTPEILKWLGSVWGNFLQRNKSYQEMFPIFDDYRIRFRKYYPDQGNFINQINNVNLVKENFLSETETDNDEGKKDTPLSNLEKFLQISSDVISAMKPTYFFLLDYYYELKINTGRDFDEAIALETGGLTNFGHKNHTYMEMLLVTCQALGILEAAYLILKKKKSSRRIITIDGKQKFLTTPEIYNVYLEKFTVMKKELVNLLK